VGIYKENKTITIADIVIKGDKKCDRLRYHNRDISDGTSIYTWELSGLRYSLQMIIMYLYCMQA
jgi:hypothetical protein